MPLHVGRFSVDLSMHAVADGSPEALEGLVTHIRHNERVIATRVSMNLWVHPGWPNKMVRARPQYAADVISDLRPPDGY